MDSATSFAHSQYDTHAISGRLHCRAASVPGNTGKRQCSLCQSELGTQLRRPQSSQAKMANIAANSSANQTIESRTWRVSRVIAQSAFRRDKVP